MTWHRSDVEPFDFLTRNTRFACVIVAAGLLRGSILTDHLFLIVRVQILVRFFRARGGMIVSSCDSIAFTIRCAATWVRGSELNTSVSLPDSILVRLIRTSSLGVPPALAVSSTAA